MCYHVRLLVNYVCKANILCLVRRFILKTVSELKYIFRKLPFSPHFLESLRLTPDRHWLLIFKTIIKRCKFVMKPFGGHTIYFPSISHRNALLLIRCVCSLFTHRPLTLLSSLVFFCVLRSSWDRIHRSHAFSVGSP